MTWLAAFLVVGLLATWTCYGVGILQNDPNLKRVGRIVFAVTAGVALLPVPLGFLASFVHRHRRK